MTIVRDATPSDIEELILLAAEMFSESQFRQYSFNPQKVADLFIALIDLRQILLVAESDGKIIGGFAGGVHEHFFGDLKMSFDYALFVLPEYRASKAGLMLLKRYIEKAKELGAAEITIGNSTGVESDRVIKLFEHVGFVRYGANMRMRA